MNPQQTQQKYNQQYQGWSPQVQLTQAQSIAQQNEDQLLYGNNPKPTAAQAKAAYAKIMQQNAIDLKKYNPNFNYQNWLANENAQSKKMFPNGFDLNKWQADQAAQQKNLPTPAQTKAKLQNSLNGLYAQYGLPPKSFPTSTTSLPTAQTLPEAQGELSANLVDLYKRQGVPLPNSLRPGGSSSKSTQPSGFTTGKLNQLYAQYGLPPASPPKPSKSPPKTTIGIDPGQLNQLYKNQGVQSFPPPR